MAYVTVDEVNEMGQVPGGWGQAQQARRRLQAIQEQARLKQLEQARVRKSRSRRALRTARRQEWLRKRDAAKGIIAPPLPGTVAVARTPGLVAPPPVAVAKKVGWTAVRPVPSHLARPKTVKQIKYMEAKKRMRKLRSRRAAAGIASQIARLDTYIARYTKRKEALLAQQAKTVAEGAAEKVAEEAAAETVNALMGW